jgi:hypothetical protein
MGGECKSKEADLEDRCFGIAVEKKRRGDKGFVKAD